jgi:NTE family protein
MLSALVDAGIRPDLVVGTSIGAINGALYAADPEPSGIDRLRELWRDVTTSELLSTNVLERVRHAARRKVAIQDTEPLRQLLTTSLPVERIEDLAVPFQCVAASIERAAEHWFVSGALVPALLASSAVPTLFEPVEIDGEHFYDGGLVNSVPLDRAVRLGATTVYVLQVGRVEQPLRPPTRFWEPALVAFEIARRHRFASLREDTPEGVTVHLLPSGNDLGFDDTRQLRWSDMGDTDRLIEGAMESASAYITAQHGS